MFFLNGLFGGLLVIFFNQLALSILDKKYSFGFKLYKGLIVERSIIVVEMISALAIFLISSYRYTRFSTVELVLNVGLIWGLSVLTITDFKRKLVPNKMLLALLLIWAVIISVFVLTDLSNSLALVVDTALGGGIAGLLFFISYILSKGQLGAGDVKLAFLMGLYLMSTRALLAFLIGTTLCFIFSFTMVLFKKLSLKDQVPLVPFLSIGALIIILIA